MSEQHALPHPNEPAVSPFSLNFQPYLPADAKARLAQYKYSGVDLSPVYQHFWKPLCACIVEWLPMWLPPNVITVSALVPIVATHFIAWWYMPYLAVKDPHTGRETEAPAWCWVVTAISLFVYQLLDNLDGYQARRTRTPSALGLLVDHGCDAINVVFQSLTVATAIQLGGTWKTMVCVVVGTAVFFANTLEHAYLGSLRLPYINGPNEGLFVMIALYVYTAFVGCGVWLREIAIVPPQVVQLLTSNGVLAADTFACTNGNNNNNNGGYGCVLQQSLPLAFMCAAGFFTVAGNFITIYKSVNAPDGPAHGVYSTSEFAKRFPFLHALNRAFPVVLFEVLAVLWFFYSPSNIFERHPRLYCWCIGFITTKLTLHLMVAHMLRLEFHPLRRSVVPFFFLALHTVLLRYAEDLDGMRVVDSKDLQRSRALHETVMLFEFFVLSACAYAHAAVNIVLETAQACERSMWSIVDVLDRNRIADEKEKEAAAKKKA